MTMDSVTIGDHLIDPLGVEWICDAVDEAGVILIELPSGVTMTRSLTQLDAWENRGRKTNEDECVEMPVKVCGLCDHEMTFDKCGSASADGIDLCHHESHDCYQQWTLYGKRSESITDSITKDEASSSLEASERPSEEALVRPFLYYIVYLSESATGRQSIGAFYSYRNLAIESQDDIEELQTMQQRELGIKTIVILNWKLLRGPTTNKEIENVSS